MIRISSPTQVPGSRSGRIVPGCRPTPGRHPARSAPSRRPPPSTAVPGPCCGSTARPCWRRRAPCRTSGSLFLVFQTADGVRSGHRLIGWEDSDVGKHGVGLLLEPGHRLQAVLRKDGLAGDLADTRPAPGFEVVCVTWGPDGTTLRRNGVAVSQKGIDGVSSDPGIVGAPHRRAGLREQCPVSRRPGGTPRLRPATGRSRAASGSRTSCIEPGSRPTTRARPPADPVAELFDELLSARGPFWPSAEERSKLLPPEHRTRRAALAHRAGDTEEEARDRDPPGGRRAGWRTQGHASRGVQGRPGLRAGQPQEARQDRAARLPAHPDEPASRRGSPRGAAASNWPTG